MFLKIIKRIVNFCLILYLISCFYAQDEHWRDIKTIGADKSSGTIGTDYQFNKFKFINTRIGFFSGSYQGRDKIGAPNYVNINRNQDAIILRTSDGGYNWQESILGKGEIIDFNKVSNALLALRKSYHGRDAEDIISHLHISKDQGATWEEVSQNKENQIDEIHFWTPQKGIGVCGLKGRKFKFTILYTEDKGKNWREIYVPKMHERMDFAVTTNGILYYLTKERTSYVKIDFATMKSEEIKFTNMDKTPFSVVLDNNDRLYFVVEDRDKRNILYQKTEGNSLKKIEFPVKDQKIYDVQIYDNTIAILADDKCYYRSDDQGETWSKERIGASYIRMVAFYGQEHVWMRTFPGQMILRTALQ
ncbi:VPS10 domain-containing protein [Flavobacterium hercynium]|uniref:Sortilin N-terminal domain-containing protein n=1 Tax=Flavobacterium hercynium TaxID=387094 RepID=A0A226HM26_9FLAO|nr:hypothetical protein [Flavobacterium hercynium]OXA94908.1 hypothetical protein B0A66_04080 [Flavobacterium hercynium]SMP09305.1 BNR/Asp-box repeat-containing protein [Flavobacterium hercynium]